MRANNLVTSFQISIFWRGTYLSKILTDYHNQFENFDKDRNHFSYEKSYFLNFNRLINESILSFATKYMFPV